MHETCARNIRMRCTMRSYTSAMKLASAVIVVVRVNVGVWFRKASTDDIAVLAERADVDGINGV